MLSACSSAHNSTLTTICIADSQLNPDINNRPSPLVLTMYQLKSITGFKNADFFPLYDKPNKTLGNDLLHREQIEIKPSQRLVITQEILPNAEYIGILAAYRDIDNAQWHRELAIKKIKNMKITLKLGQRNIILKL